MRLLFLYLFLISCCSEVSGAQPNNNSDSVNVYSDTPYIKIVDLDGPWPNDAKLHEQYLRSNDFPAASLALVIHIFYTDFGKDQRLEEFSALIRSYSQGVMQRHPNGFESADFTAESTGIERKFALVKAVATGQSTVTAEADCCFHVKKPSFIEFLLSLPKSEREGIYFPCEMLKKNPYFLELLTETDEEEPYWIECLGKDSWQPNFGYYDKLNIPRTNMYYLKFNGYEERKAEIYREVTDTDPDLDSLIEAVRSSISTSPLRKARLPLDVWALFSAWNWKSAKDTQNKFLQEKAQLVQHINENIKERRKLSELEVEKLAEFALQDDLFSSLPVPEADIRFRILSGSDLEYIKKSYQTSKRNRFDDPIFDAIAKSDWGEDLPGMPHGIKYRLRDTEALLGDPEPPFLVAVFRPEVIAWLIEQGEDVNQRNAFGKTALMTAVHLNQLETVKLLLDRGADLHLRTALRGEERTDDYGRYGDPPIQHAGRTALMYAAENASIDLVELLVKRGANPCDADSEGLKPLDYFTSPPSRSINPIITSEADKQRMAILLSCPN